jgi:RNA recognition motif-containing protein
MIKKNIYRGTCLLICMMALHLTCIAQTETVRIYVGNLPKETQESDLKSMFSKFGEIENVLIVRDAFHEFKPRGFGYLFIRKKEVVKKILEEADKFEFLGKKLTVKVSEGLTKDERTNSNGQQPVAPTLYPRWMKMDSRRW